MTDSFRPTASAPPSPAPVTAVRPTPSRIPTSTSREHILTESSSGWSPLRIAKQRPAGPLRGCSSLAVNEGPLAEDRPRRTSNSYKHLKSNSLVSNSPFKQDPSPRLSGGGNHSDGEPSPKRASGNFGLGIGLGQSPARRSPGRRVSGSGGIENEPLSSGGSSDDDNDVPGAVAARQADFRRRTKGRQSAGLANLGSKAKVTTSPFLALSLSPPPTAAELAILPLPALSPSNEDTTPSLSETSSFPSPVLEASSPSDRKDPGSPPSLKPTPTSEPIALPLLAPLTPTKPHSNLPAHVAPDAPPTPSPKSSLKSHPHQAASAGRPARQSVVRERRKTVTFDERPEISVFEREGSAELSSAVGSDDGDDDEDEYGEPFPAVSHRQGPPAQEQEYLYELSPSVPQQGSDDEANDRSARSDMSFELDLSPAGGLVRVLADAEDDPLGSHRLANLSLGSYSSDYSLNELDLGRSADDDEDPEDFVNRLLAENQLLSPVPATQTVFERYSADSEEVFGADEDIDSLALGSMLAGGSSGGRSSSEHSPALRHVGLPHLRASAADPILMNGNVLEPSAARNGSSGLTRSRSSKANLLAVNVGSAFEGSAPLPSPHAHQSGPLPDPFLTVKTIQDIVSSPANGRQPFEESGVPLGRSHHAERHRAVGELREGLGSDRLAQVQSPVRVAPVIEREGADVFGVKLALIDSPAKTVQTLTDRTLAPLSPYSLPSLTSQSPLLFGSFDMATPDPAAGSSAAEFGGGFRPSSSLERLQQGEVNGSVGSSGGRSPRLTKESIRRRMELKAAAAAVGSVSASKPDAATSRGLGLGLPESAIAEGLSTPSSGSPVKKDTPLPPAPTSAERPRPTILTSSRAPSAEEILSRESALGKLASRSSSASPLETSETLAEATHSLKEGSGKDVLISPVSATFAEASSTAVEEASAPVVAIPRSLSRATLDAQLMPPPPLPLSRAPSPTPNVIRAPSPASSAQSQGDDEGVAARQASIDTASVSRRSRPRRSLSHGDVTEEASGSSLTQLKVRERKMGRLSIGPAARNSANLSELNKEFERIGTSNKRYTVIEHEPIFAASDEKVSHSARSGDLDRGKAWRSVKRPSDMNEYADEIREIRMREKPGRAHAKVFVKIVGMSDLTIPLQSNSQSSFRIALNNGLHSVETSSYPLRSKVEIGQEFELLGLENLEFSLAIKVKKDNHIATRLKALNPPAPEAPATPSKKESGFRKLMSSPRRAPKASPVRPTAEEPPQDELVRYLSPDGTLATVKIVFKDIAARCNGQLLSLHLPLSGKWNDDSLAYSSRFASSAAVRRSKTIGRLELQLIMIPSLPGLTQDQLPQSLEDAVVGLRHVRWHKMDYYAGTLTQLGGDCSSWRRRQMRIVGGLLEATSDITGKITARIDLAKMTAIRDYNAEEITDGDIDRPMSVERSFGLIFEDSDEIQFFADKDQDKADWLAHLHELLGRVPSLPLWSELLWVKQQQQQQQQQQAASAPART